MHDLGLSDKCDDMEGQPSSTFTLGIPANLPCTWGFGPNINQSSCTAVSSPAIRPFHAKALSSTIPPPHAEALSPTTSPPLCTQVFDDIVVVEDKHSSKDQQNQPLLKTGNRFSLVFYHPLQMTVKLKVVKLHVQCPLRTLVEVKLPNMQMNVQNDLTLLGLLVTMKVRVRMMVVVSIPRKMTWMNPNTANTAVLIRPLSK